MSIEANGLRDAFTRFFTERGHVSLAPASLIPHDPSVLFTIAGMVPLKPYFLGEQPPPAPRATTIQPCFRTVDIDVVGTTARHTTFFEMLGNFSFGDYFKEGAIPLAFELVTEVFGFDPDRLWITVHESDEDATGIWLETSGLPPERIQKMGEDNFWKMGELGPCGPSSEIYFDRGEAYGAGGGPAHGGGDRYIEFWNLVFMQYERLADGRLVDLPRKNIDTGAGLERILALMSGADSVFSTDVFSVVIDEAARLTKTKPGASAAGDVALRILSDHARAMSFLVSDGVFPSNEGRGYVLRRIIRRAVLRAYQLGAATLVTPELCGVVVQTMAGAYPRLARDASLVATVVAHEEEAFRRTLRAGTALLGEELDKGASELSGEVAFRLHDTFGFPLDLTVEVAAERGVGVDLAGFETHMADQRARARAAAQLAGATEEALAPRFREVIEHFGRSEFLGYRALGAPARVLALVETDSAIASFEGEPVPPGHEAYDLVLDRTPFYAEGGGQVGDTGVIETPTGTFRVLDTTSALEGLTRHRGYVVTGEMSAGQEADARVDATRRDAIRRNHTATHLLQAALREVLGSHVAQQGSLVAPGYLRFDFSHFAAPSPDELGRVEQIVNAEVLADHAVRVYETSRAEAEQSGAIAFFGDKYGEVVRVVEAGERSVELCGGTHVHGLGMIGLFRIVSEGSIGANTRRIVATTGEASMAEVREQQAVLERIAHALRTSPHETPAALDKVLAERAELEEALREVRASAAGADATELASGASNGRVVARRDGRSPAELRAHLERGRASRPSRSSARRTGCASPSSSRRAPAASTHARSRPPRPRRSAAVAAARQSSRRPAGATSAGSTRRSRCSRPSSARPEVAAPAPESKALAGGPDRHGRVLGLDLGNVRVGVALSSSDRRVALAHAVLAGGEPTALVAAVSRLCAEHDVALVVVGVPYGLSGARTARARQAEALIATLADQLEIPVVGADERLSTVEAEQARRIALTARDRARRRGRGGRAGAANRRRQPVLDAEAAAVVLQAYLDAQRHRFGGEA